MIEGFVPGDHRPPEDIIDAGEHTATIPNVWLAFHFENFEPTEQSELFEVIAASKGVRVKFFDNADGALNWLRTNVPT